MMILLGVQGDYDLDYVYITYQLLTHWCHYLIKMKWDPFGAPYKKGKTPFKYCQIMRNWLGTRFHDAVLC